MNLTELLENLSAKNVELWVDGDKLRYRAPENVLTPELLGEIKQYKPEIIRIFSADTDHVPTYRLSHGQKALWFLYQLAPTSTAYNATYAAKLVPNLDILALKQATQALVERHPVMRATFATIDGEPVQTVHENQQVDLNIQEAFDLGEEEVNNWLSETSDRPFDLEQGPILRFDLLINHTTTDTLATKEQILLITVHHIVVDFWSLEIMIGELRVLYEAIIKGVAAQLPTQNCQYQDYVNWSEQMLSSSEGERLWSYWQQQLSGELPLLNLPTDRPRPEIQTYNGASSFFTVEEKLRQLLTELAKREGASLYTVFLTALQILLFRYSNQEDILIGSPMVNRSRSEFEKIVGYFTNSVVLRADLSGNPTFQELLGQERSCVLNALDHQEYPFLLLVDRLQPVRDPSFSPLYQVALAWDRSHQSDQQVSLMDSDGLVVESMIPGAKGAAFDLTLTILELPGTLKGTWNYNTDLFDASTIERMSGHFVTMLEAIVANPQQRISQLPLLTESELHQLLVEWNDTSVDYPHDLCIHQLFSEQAARTPDAVAVVFEGQQLTYGELNSRANQLAHYLQSLGVSADVLVGICVERSLEMVVGLLGILKAGGAYVPLDPEYPAERLNFMLEDAAVSLLLTQQHLVDKLPQHQAQLVCLDEVWEQILQNKQDNPTKVVTALNLANVIYTSGSTGKPKGVMVEHRGLCNLAQAQIQMFGLNSDSRTLQFASLSFDACISEVLMAFGSGATLYLGTKDSLMPGTPLIERLRDDGITHVTLPPSALAVLPTEELPALQTIIVAGEACSIELIRQWSALRNFFNAYGPTEASVCATIAKCTPNDQKVSIGRPINNTQLYILDQNLQPVPVGVPGELHIGGAGLARGYLNRPDLTLEKFISNPFYEAGGSRLYKTGDLARYLPDGNIEYLGRIDNQVKIRGFRIELGEIEAILCQHEDVQASVVIARADTPGDKRLVAYVVPHSQQTPTVTELRSFLKSKLPEYMVPSFIVILESLPLTPNGKVDRRALPAPEPSSESTDKFVAPRTPVEEILAVIWTQVLKVEVVGIHDNFFSLGGHSLLATQLISRVRTTLKVELALRSLFATPTIAELSKNIQQLQQENLELSAPPILPRVENAEIPLSFAQQRLWFLDQLEPDSASYNIPVSLRLVGNLSLTALEESLREIIYRHEALRTNFITVNGKPEQIIQTQTNWTVSVVDFQHLPLTEQEIATQELAKQEALLGFDLASEPLFRARLILLSQTEHVLLVCMHHVVSDGWSMGVFVSELTALYNAYSIGQPSPLTPLPIQYADFAIWQRLWLQGSVLQSQLSYWQEQLANAPTFLPLPTDRPRPAVQTYHGAYQQFALSVELTQKLTKLSQEQGVTLFMTLLAAFDTLLYRYTGVTDILVGSPIANRDRTEIEGLIGFFVNTLVMRTDVSGDPSFNELLPRIREMALSVYAHQDLPFEMLVEALQPERDLAHTPLFQVMFVLQNAPMSQVELNGLTISHLPIESATSKFDLTLSMENTATGLVGAWEYNTDLFDSSTIERMAGHFVTMLEAIVANPQQRISQLPLLTESELHQLLVEWNDTSVDYPHDLCIHQLFSEQVARTPDAVAVVFENQQLTYGELNSRANQLAHYLQSLGVSADVLVGICVERSLEMVVGLLGILKAGGAYVPLDPEYPAERLNFMLEDAAVSLLLTQQHLVDKLPQHQAQLVCLDEVWEQILQNKQDNPTKVVTALNLANVIYTSGSTGKPKGVMVEHRGLCNLAQAQIQMFGLNSDSRTLQFASLSFDACIWEVLMAFGSGATLYLGTKDSLMPGTPLIERLRDDGITHVTLPPSALAVLPTEELPALQTIIVAGEACSIELIRQWSALRNFFNAYGPTEASVCATIAKCTPNDQKVSIGRPINNTQLYILDQNLQPVPVGVPGELHIGGAGLARGYLNRPDLTLEKFISNPFYEAGGSRLYKTGDLARYLPDGNIEYLGRIDNQVKIRGFRIELGEIEAILCQHEDVQASVVIARADTPGDKRLVAYVVPHSQQTPTVTELRSFLKSKLPEYMVPSFIVILESLPLTPNGKVDRRALPAPEPSSESTDKFVAPRTPVEEILAVIWTQVLKVEVVGIHDNFFSLGGHSLLATQLISRVRTTLKVELALRSLFATPTIAELSKNIQQLQQENLELSAPPILPRVENAEIPLSFAQQRLWFLDQLEPDSASYNIPVSLRLVGNLSLTALEESLREIIYRHEALRTNFITVNGKPEQIIQTQTNWTVSVVDFQHLPLTEQEIATQELAKQEALLGFDLASEPLFRARLILLSQTEHVLLVCMHHVVSDGWSMGVFVSELTALYNAYSIGQPSPLTPLPIQYADFAIWQRLWLQGSVLQSQLSYWQEQLANAPTFLPLPTDRPRPAVQTYHGAYQQFALSVELTQKLTKLSQEQGVTLFMTLLAAFDTLLYRYTGVTDILVGSPIANRDRTEIEGLIGFFVNTLVMRTDVSGDPSFNELLPRIREMALSVYAHQDLPFEMLVEALQPERDLAHTPLFQVMFVLQNAPMSQVELNGLTISHLPIESATSKFDLTLSMENTATGLVGAWEYNTDLFDSSTIERMAGHFVTMLEAIVANPQQRISQLPLLTESELHQLLVEWNDTSVDYPHDLCIHQLFSEQVARTPDAVAVVFENQQLTYGELNSRANQLAHYLQTLGVSADVLVGICVERSLEMVVGLLGILKAGGAYVPLDPEYPTERLSFMLEDAAVSLLLTQQHLVDKLPQHQAQLVCLDTSWQLISHLSQDNARADVQASNLAYVIYTSGSTGRPKGAENTHLGVCNRLLWMQQAYQLTAVDCVLQKTPFSFDVSVWEFFWPLLAGARLVVAKPGGHQDSGYLVNLILEQQVTTLHFVPSMLQVFLEEQGLESCSSLKRVICSGEALPKELQERFFARLGCQLHNLYGPTEAAIDVTFWQCQPESNLKTVPIGRPIYNTQLYILDQNLQPVPVGVPGELHIGGAGLARGYLNRPDLTLEKFISNPFYEAGGRRQEAGGSKLYKTGDLARYLPDGNIEYLGRIDNQVKIRGFRIELGEIEATLGQHEDVQASCVIARVDNPSVQRLVAYIVPQPQITPTITQLREFLKSKLPDYMVPSAFMILESLPLTPNGKIDRRALPAPESRTGIEIEIVPARNPIEEKLAQIWAQVLRVESIGIHDNFFELGGDSILSIQIITRAKLAGLSLSVKQLFANQTIAELATVAGTTKALLIEQGLVTGTLPLTPIQQWFFEQDIPEKHHFNQSFLLTVPSNINLEILEQVWQQLLRHHDALRLRFSQTDFTWQQIHAAPSDSNTISYFDFSTIPDRELEKTIESTANSLQVSLNLSENLVQVALFFLGREKKARLLIVIHHLVVDGVSWRILLEDLQNCYEQLSQFQSIQLPAKTTSFKDWAQKLTLSAQSEVLKSELAYWLSASDESISLLPVDYAEGVNTAASISTVSVSLNSAQTLSLLQDVPKAYKTQINDVLLTALAVVLSKWTNSKSVLFNLEGHGREDIIDGVDLSRTIGWFTTIFPVVLKLEAVDKENIGNALKSVKEQLRAIPNKGIGYGLLRYLNSDAEISAQLQTIPASEISFNYLGQFAQVLNTSSIMQLASESSGISQSLQGQRSTLLDINAIIANEELKIDWTHSSNIHQHETIENIAQEFVETLGEIIAHCLSPENAGYTPTDFPLIKLNQLELDGVLARLPFKPELGKTNWQNIEDIYPLSPMQEGMLFESLYAPDSGVYFEQLTCTFTGNLNVEAFEQAWQRVVEKHSIFRTAFVWEFLSQPLQVVYREVLVKVVTTDWREFSKIEQQEQLETFLAAQRLIGFQLSLAPLIRLHLIQLDGNTYQFVWCHHHLLLDGWSLPLVFKDLLDFYRAIFQSVSLPVPATLGYYNYIAWLQQQDQDLAQEFWREKLLGFTAPTPMTVDKPLSNREQHSSYSEQEIQLTASATTAIGSFARQHQLTISNLVQATWGLLLCRYSGESDVVFGATVSGRPPGLVGVESMVGLFINTLPVRVQIRENTQLLSLLKDLQAQQVEAEQFSYSSLAQIQALSDVTRGTSLFESIVVFENYPVDTAVLEDNSSFSISNVRAIEQTNYPLTILAATGEQFLLKVSYNASRFEHETINRMLGHFLTLLEAIVANPQQRISQLPLLTESELHQLLVEWNDTTSVDYPHDLCIHQLFSEQAARTPDAVAVVFEGQQLTYGELNSRANQLAHYLQSLGVSADVLVGICVERSLEMVVGLLGILKAGGAYVPLDPEYPTERLSFMLEDAAVSLLLTQQHLVDKLPQHQAQLVCLDTTWETISQLSQENLISGVQGNNLGYVIYTSGSTGQPKGVAMNQFALCNLILWQLQNPTISSGVKTLQFAPISFDVSFQEMFSTWFAGGTLVLIGEQLRREPLALLGLLQEQAVERVFVPFVALQQLAEVAVSSNFITNNLSQIITAGEQLQITPAISQWLSQLKDCTLHNHYGPSESHVVTTFTLTNSVDTWPLLPPIGRPIANTQIYILDQYLQPVPVGVPGELHIGGVSLARGYLNRSELTVEKFISNPFCGSREGERLYKTGDLARYLPDGNIEYLGRIDNQVKIRGFRIELGEIEAILCQYEHVQASCVIARVDNPSDKRLVAYIVPEKEQTPTITELRQFLKSKLPEYMIPSFIVILESLPLTPNGKVDRRALPAPELSSESTEKFVAPRTPVEEILAVIWTQVLRVEPIGIHDNFFTLGGHSLLATQVISRIRTSLKVELPLRSLFAEATIAQLSQNIQQLQQQNLELSAPPILARVENAEIPLSFAQQRLWFLDQLEPNSPFYNIPGSLRLLGTLNRDALEESLREIIYRHEALRTNFITVNGKPEQIIQTQTNWTVSVVDFQHLPLTEQEIATQELAKQEALLGFDLASEPLFRARLILLSQTEHVLLVCMHHVVSDGWSMGVFVSELTALYNAYSIGQPSPLTPLPIQYADFAIWQRLWLQGSVLQSQLSYWQEQLANAPTFLPLPTDRPRPAVQTYHGAYQQFALSVELTQKLTKLSQEQGVTLFMTLLAAFDTLLYRYTGVTDILVGSPIANRDRTEIEGLIGFFVNTLVMRTDVSGDPSFNELLPRIREMALSAYAHQDLPFEMLVEALQPERDLAHTPLFQVMFVLQNAPMSQVELNGLTISHLPIESATSKFDLTLSMENTATGLVGAWEYNTDLFDSSTIERMAGHFVTMLEAIVANPQQRISQLPLLTESELHQLLVEWNDTSVDYPHDLCIHQLFSEQAARTPDAVAVVFEGQQLTYGELNSRANQLAHYLQTLGVSADVLVGICVERSLEMVVGLLGILKAGGAYVPLDPEYPTERLSFMLEDAAVSLLLTQQHLVDKLPQHQAQLVCLDTSWQLISHLSQDNARADVQASNLAYVIYTSGSTGKPKGVMIPHEAIASHCCIIQKAYALVQSDCVLQFASINFDASLEQIFPTLIVGATLVLRGSDVWTPTNFQKIISDFGLTVVNLPTAYWQQLAQEWVKTKILDANSRVRLVLVGGDVMLPEYVALWQQSPMSYVRLLNAYGPTESTITATLFEIPPQFSKDTNLKKIPIGCPLPNKTVYILDQHLQPVPVGVPGELHIGGAGLARGYLNRPDLTLEKFIPNPFDRSLVKGQNSKLYKTGDLGRYLPDGNIEYLGRIDNQVKIRGFRIELGEIEAILCQHEDVQASVVIARADTSGDKRLVAYVVPHSQQTCTEQLVPNISTSLRDATRTLNGAKAEVSRSTPTVSVLREFLKAKLPEYMVPSTFVILESLPLTPNGKIDRRALPEPSGHNASDTIVSPRNTVELQLVQIWSKILQVDNVGVKDNFFDLGGHSLLAPYLMAQIKQQFGKDIPLATLFQHPTIEELATMVQKDTDASGWSPLVAIQPNGSNPPLFCLPGAGGFPFYLYKLARCLGLDQPFYTFQAHGRERELAVISQVEDIAAQYLEAMQVVQPQGPYFLAGHSFGGKVVYEMAQQLLSQGQVVALVAILDTTAPIAQPKQEEWDDVKHLIETAKLLKVAFTRDLDMDADPLLSLAPEDQLKYVLEYLKMVDILPPDADITYLKKLLQAFKADGSAEYVPQQVNPLAITLFRASESVPEEPVALQSELLQDLAWGWSAFSSQPVDVQFVPGTHVTMITQPHVQVLAQRLKACIDQAQALI